MPKGVLPAKNAGAPKQGKPKMAKPYKKGGVKKK